MFPLFFFEQCIISDYTGLCHYTTLVKDWVKNTITQCAQACVYVDVCKCVSAGAHAFS